jgi:hypothetical protein
MLASLTLIALAEQPAYILSFELAAFVRLPAQLPAVDLRLTTQNWILRAYRGNCV